METEIKKVIDDKISNGFIEKEVEKNLREKVKHMIYTLDIKDIDFSQYLKTIIDSEETQELIKKKVKSMINQEFYQTLNKFISREADNIAKKCKFEITLR